MTKETDILQEVYRINIRDAAALVKIFEESGDIENLQRAKEDLRKWEEKQRKFEEKQRN